MYSTFKNRINERYLDIKGLLARNNIICEERKRFEARKLQAESKSEFIQTKINEVLIDI